MKKGEVARYAGEGLSRDEIRRRLYLHGVKNFYQEVEMDSELADAHRDVSFAAAHVTQHSHRFLEIICCVRGRLGYLLDTRRYQIQPGDIIIVPPGVTHLPILPDQMTSPYVRDVVWVSPLMLEYIRKMHPDFRGADRPLVLSTAGTGWEYLTRLFEKNTRESETKAAGWEVCVYGNTAQLLIHLSRAAEEPDGCYSAVSGGDLLEKVLDYVRENMSGRITLTDTARQFHISESTLTHLFSREMGMGFYRCVTQRRLAEAKNQIARGLSMEEAGRSVGYSEYSAFYRAFRAEYGISPLQYRKLIAAQENREEERR